MSGMRILQIAHDHPQWTPGGTEILAHDLARALDARPGVSARFLAAGTSLQRPGATAGTLEAIGQDYVLMTGAYDRFSMMRMDGDAWLAGLERVLRSVRPDVVHLHGVDRLGAEVIPAIRQLAPRSRIVLTLHDYQLICANDGLLLTTHDGSRCAGAQPDRCRRCFPDQTAARHAMRRAHLLALLDLVDLLIAPSAFLHDRFTGWGVDALRIRVVPNAVRPSDASPRVGPQRARPDRFGFFGAIASHKGALVLLEAAERLSRDDDLSIVMHGGLGWAAEAFRADFEARLLRAGAHVQLFEPYPPGEAVRLMQEVDWVVVPSIWWENAPLVQLEASAAGRPVICSGIGGMAELTADGVSGVHVPPGDAAALAEAMRTLSNDPRLWAQLAAAAQQPASHDAFVDRHLELYSNLSRRAAA